MEGLPARVAMPSHQDIDSRCVGFIQEHHGQSLGCCYKNEVDIECMMPFLCTASPYYGMETLPVRSHHRQTRLYCMSTFRLLLLWKVPCIEFCVFVFALPSTT